ncbi:MAG: hypothetical protein EAZ07_09330 [Cytophagales bacterium]|nr:MAG: hypothetical protein EAZ07_09330 [Cytophagales bacterium]
MKICKIIIFIFIVIKSASFAQDLSAIGKDNKPFKISGSVSANQIFYTSDGIKNRRPPYNYFLSGNLNISVYGWSIPLSYTFSNQNSQFQQPFNQFGMQPTYKWVKLYAGWNSMSFSAYSMNGHVFLGGGIQLTPPNNFRFSAMLGRLNKAIEEDTTNPTVTAAYQRMGGGFKVGYGKGTNFIDLILFTAKDNITSLDRPILKSQVLPAENAVASLVFSKTIAKKITISGEYATSALTRDVRFPTNEQSKSGIANTFVPFLKPNASTSIFDAFKVNANYSGSFYTVGVGFERIDPGYKTLGAYYFNDDLQNITGNGTLKLLKGKLNLTSNIGLQKNDLRNEKLSQMQRLVWSGSISFAATKRLNLSAGYSSFQSFTRIKTLEEQERAILQQQLNSNIDTLRFTQISQSANSAANYSIGNLANKDVKNTLNFTFSYQTAGEKRGDQNISAGTNFYNSNIGFNRNMNKKGLTIGVSINTNYNELEKNKSFLLGPSINISKSFFDKKVKATFTTSWTNSFNNGVKNSEITNARLSANYTFKKKLAFNSNFTIINRFTRSQSNTKNNQSFTEFTFTLGITYSF